MTVEMEHSAENVSGPQAAPPLPPHVEMAARNRPPSPAACRLQLLGLTLDKGS